MHCEFIESLVTNALGTAARILACEQLIDEVRQDRFRVVYRVTVRPAFGPRLTTYAKVGNDFQVKKEAALYRHVLDPDVTATPALLSYCEEDGVLAFLIGEASGTPFEPKTDGHLRATMTSVARLHENCRPNLHKVTEVLKPAPPAQTMFDRLRSEAASWNLVGLTERDIEIFYSPNVVELMEKDPPTLVHGDLSKANVFVASDRRSAVFIDFGMAMVLPSTAEFMYFPDSVITQEVLSHALRCYSDGITQGLSFSERRICQLYWHASYYADCLVSEMPGSTEMNAASREMLRGFVDRLRFAGEGISRLITELA